MNPGYASLLESLEETIALSQAGLGLQRLSTSTDDTLGLDLSERHLQQTHTSYDSRASLYAQRYEWRKDYLQHSEDPFLQLLSMIPSRDTNSIVLDLGCGTFHSCVTAKNEYALDVYGVDMSSGMLKEGARRLVKAGIINPEQYMFQDDISRPGFASEFKELLQVRGKRVGGIAINSALTHIAKSQVDRVLSDVARDLMEEKSVLWFGLKLSSDDSGRVWRDTKIEKVRYFTTYSKSEVIDLAHACEQSGLVLESFFVKPHHDPDKPVWLELYWTKKGAGR